MPGKTSSRLRFKAAAFVALTYLLSAALDWSALQAIGGVMWAPGLSAVMVQLVFERRISGLGWRLPGWRWAAAALAFPMAYVGIAYAVSWLSGAALMVDEPLGWIKEILYGPIGIPRLPDWAVVPAFAVIVLTLGMSMSVVAALGEEIGWRGLLLPALDKSEGFLKASLITGLAWAVWHWSAILSSGYNAGGDPALSLIPFTVMIVALSVGMGWLTVRSGSLWPAVIVHAAHNTFIQGAFEPLTQRPAQGQWVTGEWGVAIPAAILGLTVVVAWYRRRYSSPVVHCSPEAPRHPLRARL